jgi:acyl-CoA oxidase
VPGSASSGLGSGPAAAAGCGRPPPAVRAGAVDTVGDHTRNVLAPGGVWPAARAGPIFAQGVGGQEPIRRERVEQTVTGATELGETGDWPEVERPLLPFVPMIYIAWADGVLTGAEMRAIARKISGQKWLDVKAREVLGRWLNPERPPSAAQLQALLVTMRDIGRRLPSSTRVSLAALGLELARVVEDDDTVWSSPEVEAALAEIEEALGVAGGEASRFLVETERVAVLPARPAPFDAAVLNTFLDADHAETRQEVLALLASPAFHRPIEPDRPVYREQVLAWCRLLAERGYGAAAYPEEFGGGGDIAGAIAIFETLAYHDLSLTVKYGVHFGLFGGSILALGTRVHHERYLPEVATLALPGCYAMTETGHGSNVRELQTTATYDVATGDFVLHTPDLDARKDYIGNAALHGRMATVFAQLEVGGEVHGVHAFVVPLRDEAGAPLPGITIEDCGPKHGLNGVDNGRIRFDRVRVPREQLLDRFGSVSREGVYTSPIPSPSRRFFTMLGTLVAGRISIAAAAASAAKSGLTIAIRYTDRRRQFGPAGEPEVPVLDYLTLQRSLLPRLATTYALHFALRDLVTRYGADPEGDPREIEVLAAGIKAYSSRHTVATLQACREACGGQGYLAENRLGPLLEDTDIFTTFEGANAVLEQLVTKGLLTDYKESFGELRLWGVVRLLAGRASSRLGRNPIVTRRTDPEHLRDPDFHSAAFEFREERLLGTVARRLKHRIDRREDSFAALNETQDHFLHLARAHIERVLLERFQEGVEACPDDAARRSLRSLYQLFALSRLEADRAWFLESGYMEPSKSKAIRGQVNELCRAVRPAAVALADAFGIPDPVLGAPIAQRA